ncbi:MAG: VWA domain-containing protein [Gammaproteobacteria bacterium]|nr:VWA domain-containing protein [Gammaproteobacteria bacterium]NNK31544.1 VWA domain-containing protein [Xanthomonadales bacterium]
MRTKLYAIALFTLTLGAVLYYPHLSATTQVSQTTVNHHITAEKPRVDVVFVLDTTGSMSGLIQTAKDKIWSIATTMASAQPTPEIRIGLVAYRDRGDQYVTRRVDLSSDLDSVYAALMDFKAEGGGDTPESVNQALHDAVHGMSWSQDSQAYRVVFLVGDAPPHMDYNEVQYPQIVTDALDKGIVINTIQCGEESATVGPWTQIASLGQGNFFQVEQAGGAIAFTTPYDREIADLSARLDDTRLYYGSDEEKAKMSEKVAATDKLHAGASLESRARRGVFNAAAGGRANLLGEKELVSAVASGEIQLDEIEAEALPEALQPMAPAEQEAYLVGLASERNELQQQIRDLSEDRDSYLAKKVEEAGGLDDSLDRQIHDAVREQAGKAGLEYGEDASY